jgi:hypothetical protein
VGAFLISRQIRQNINPPVFEQFLERRISESSIGSTISQLARQRFQHRPVGYRATVIGSQ